jgi:lipopolysaccharide export system permease protein
MMSFTILDRYLAKRYLAMLGVVFLAVAAVLFIFDFIELTRIGAAKGVAMEIVLFMTLQKVPLHMQKIAGFLVMIAAMLTLMKAARDNEIIIMRVMGISTVRSVFSISCVSLVLGVVYMSVFNPMAAALIEVYERNEARYLKGSPSVIALSKNGIWLKNEQEDGHIIMHAMRLVSATQTLHDVVFYYFDSDAEFTRRYDAPTAVYSGRVWQLSDAILNERNAVNQEVGDVTIPAHFSFLQIQENLTLPDSLSFWKLPHFISVAEEYGLSVKKHKLHFYKLLMAPIFFLALALIGAVFAKRFVRFHSLYRNIFYCLGLGFVLYFVSDMMAAFAIAGELDVVVGALAPVIISLLVASALFLQEKVV